MTGPSWFAGALAALMILVAAAAGARLCWWRPHGRAAEADADALHVLTGIAMAGMFEPGIGPVPAIAWQVVFAAAAAWFTWQAARRRRGRGTRALHSHPGPHVVECGAMLYMLWPAGARQEAARMPGMTGHAGAIAGNPALALVLAAGMLGYIVWALDQLLFRTRPSTGAPVPRPNDAARQPLAPRLAACQKITMGLAMGYMLLTML